MSKLLKNIFLLAFAAGFVWACAAPTVPQVVRPVQDFSYTDDPSNYRPKVIQSSTSDSVVSAELIENTPIEAQFNIDDQLQSIVDSMFIRNDSIRQYSGFTILVYSGNDELEAGRVRNRLFDMVPDQEAQFSFKLPTYFVKIGNYFQQIEAEPMLKMIQETYPSAAIVPEKFPIIISDEARQN